MKKIIALLLVLVMVLSLAACGAKADEKTTVTVIAAQYGDKTADWWKGFEEKFEAAITKVVDAFYDDQPYAEWVVMENFIPATSTGGEICIQLQPDLESWINLVAGAQFYPAAKAEWMDVKQGVINVLQQALLGGDVETLLNDLQAQIAG